MNIKQYMSYADVVSLGNASFGFLSIINGFKWLFGSCCAVYACCSDL